MDSEQVVKIGKIVLRYLVKRGARDLMAYGLPMKAYH